MRELWVVAENLDSVSAVLSRFDLTPNRTLSVSGMGTDPTMLKTAAEVLCESAADECLAFGKEILLLVGADAVHHFGVTHDSVWVQRSPGLWLCAAGEPSALKMVARWQSSEVGA